VTENPGAPRPRWELTHQRIYDVALELFQKEGFENVSVGQIAKGAKISAPTFYAHYPSKEHLVMQVPTVEDLSKLLAGQPADLSLPERLRRAVPLWFADWTPEYREAQLARWRVIATTPALRTRAAEFERFTAELVGDAVPAAPGQRLSQADQIILNAYLATFTAGMLAWADCNGERKLEELLDEAFEALQGMAPPKA
jgi:AcrR family transcriptional regulator